MASTRKRRRKTLTVRLQLVPVRLLVLLAGVLIVLVVIEEVVLLGADDFITAGHGIGSNGAMSGKT